MLACGNVEPPADTAGGESAGILTQGTPSTGDEGSGGAEGTQSGGSNETMPSGSQSSGAEGSGGEDEGSGLKFDPVSVGGLNPDQYGIYGAAVDSEGNFWATPLSGARMIKVTMADMSTQVWTPPRSGGYSMTVDVDGYVCICASTIQRYDPATDTSAASASGIGSSGCMADGGDDGLLWAASGGMIRGVNPETLQVDREWPVPGSSGISVDFAGNIWAVASGDGAHRVDPDTGVTTSFYGLVGA